MTMLVLIKIFASLVTGMLGIPLGMLPSIFLYRDLANGTDSSEETKQAYEYTLWAGMVAGWLATSLLCWWVLGWLF